MRGLQFSEVSTPYFDIRSRSGPGSCILSLGIGTHSSGRGVSRATASWPLTLRNRRCDPSVPSAMGRIVERFVKSLWGCMTRKCWRSYKSGGRTPKLRGLPFRRPHSKRKRNLPRHQVQMGPLPLAFNTNSFLTGTL